MNDAEVLTAVDSKRDAALAAHRFVHEHPELSHEEHECARHRPVGIHSARPMVETMLLV